MAIFICKQIRFPDENDNNNIRVKSENLVRYPYIEDYTLSKNKQNKDYTYNNQSLLKN